MGTNVKKELARRPSGLDEVLLLLIQWCLGKQAQETKEGGERGPQLVTGQTDVRVSACRLMDPVCITHLIEARKFDLIFDALTASY